MDTELKGRVALVTGSTTGLGRAIAEALALEKAKVIINGRKPERVNYVARVIRNEHKVRTYTCCCDGTNPEAVENAVAKVIKHTGKLDILVNNVGNIEKFGNFENLEDQDWLRSFDLICMSAVRFVQASLPYLRKSQQPRIINISSLSAHQPGSFNPHYSMAKAALLNLTKYLANYLGKDQILVNAVCPSTLAGGGWHQNIRDRAKRDGISANEAEEIMRREENKKSPLGRIGGLNDVSNLVVFLCSSEANFLTGHCYNVDGGITRTV